MSSSRRISIGTPKMAHRSTPMLAPPTALAKPQPVPSRCTRRHQHRRRARFLSNAANLVHSGQQPECTDSGVLKKRWERRFALADKAAFCMPTSAGNTIDYNASHTDEVVACPLMAWLAEELEAKASLKESVSFDKQIISPGEAWLATGLKEKVSRSTLGTGCYDPCSTCSTYDQNVAFVEDEVTSAAPHTSCRRQRKVRFNLRCTTVHHVTPYSEIYGHHPREFVFDANSQMIPAGLGGFVSLESLCGDPNDDNGTESS